MERHVLAIDEGTTGVRAMVFDSGIELLGSAYEEVTASFPRPGWVEQDPLQLWQATQRVMKEALRVADVAPSALAAIGLTNQRATTLVWDRGTGSPIHAAIGWQDNRTAERARELSEQGFLLNSMAAATKLEWILRHQAGGVERAAAGELCFGTVDTWLAWRLSGGEVHVTDRSNASCSGLYDFAGGRWDERTADALGIPITMMPAIRPSSESYGTTHRDVLGAAVPIAGMAGDQQAAMFGELGIERGAVKITIGTSAMVDINSGDTPVLSRHGAYPLILWMVDGESPWCLEGTVATAGAAVQWLRDGLGLVSSPHESGALAASVTDSAGVWAIPAFQGLGTPYMDPKASAVIGGLSRGSTRAHVVRAVLEGIAFRAREVLEALLEDTQTERPEVLRVDGGAAANDFLLQTLANVLGQPVERPEALQASALGAAFLAGIAVGLWAGVDELRHTWRSGGVFEPRWSEDERETRFAAWRNVIAAANFGVPARGR
jgi:glycerol kinase